MDRLQRGLLLAQAKRYIERGYRIGFAKAKAFVGEYLLPTNPYAVQTELPFDWDGISIIPKNIAVIDFDCDFKDLGWRRDYPPTWKERTPRGWHLFYRLPDEGPWQSRVSFVKDVDLLTAGNGVAPGYGKKRETRWGGHVILSPTPGYIRIWPNELPKRQDLVEAPLWLVKELSP